MSGIIVVRARVAPEEAESYRSALIHIGATKEVAMCKVLGE
jgi:hypothetical protein